MPQPTHTPTGTFPDLTGGGGTGPLQIQAAGEVFSSAILIKSADPAMGLMCKLIDACDWLKTNTATAASLAAYIALVAKQTASSGDTLVGVLTYAGRFTTIATGTLRTAIQKLADTAATHGPSTAITPAASTATMAYDTSQNYHIFTPSASVLTVTLKSTSPVPPDGAEFTFCAYDMADTKQIVFEREDATQPVTMTGIATGQNFGSVTFKYTGSYWHVKHATGMATQWSATWPSSLNDP